MKNFSEFEDKILDSEELMRKMSKSAFNNMGKIIAFIVSAVMIAVTFADISFRGFFTEDFLGSLLLLITSAYIIYFSLEDSGEKSGSQTPEYINAKAHYDSAREKIHGEDIESLRTFCEEYTKREAISRRNSLILSHGLPLVMLEDYKSGKKFNKKTEKILKKASRIRPASLSVGILLCREKGGAHSELENPNKRKLPMLILKLLPSTVCMAVTVSVMLSAKDGMSLSDVLNSILKLSALPLIGFRGYSTGYSYAKHSLSLWMETKANVLDAFSANKIKNNL